MRERYKWILILLLVSPVSGQDISTVYHDNVVIVVDASGSMKENWTGTQKNKMDFAKEAMKTVLARITVNTRLAVNTRLGILVFGGGNDDWVYPLGPMDYEALENAIDSIRTGGGTPLGTYIKRGADALVQQREKQFGYGSYRLLIVTDGEASGRGEERKMKEFTQEIIARGINVDVIGVDMGAEHALAKIVGDNYRTADNPASLTKAITEVFAEVSRDDASDAAQSFELLEGLDPALAKEMIGALAKPQNHPIGEKPKLRKRPSSNAVSSTTDWDLPEESSTTGWAIGIVVIVIVIGTVVMINIFGRNA